MDADFSSIAVDGFLRVSTGQSSNLTLSSLRLVHVDFLKGAAIMPRPLRTTHYALRMQCIIPDPLGAANHSRGTTLCLNRLALPSGREHPRSSRNKTTDFQDNTLVAWLGDLMMSVAMRSRT